MTTLTFLGTGNFLAPGRYWNSFVIDRAVLVEPSPTALPNLRRAGLEARQLDTILISHFHADHTFGWPFLLLELFQQHGASPVFVVGPPGVRDYLADMTRVGWILEVQEEAHARLDIRYIEVDGTWQDAGALRFRAVEVEHVPYLQCFGYLVETPGGVVGYSGDTHPCPGLDELAREARVLVLECNGRHPWPAHMDTAAVRELAQRFPDTRLILTHLGGDVEPDDVPGCQLPDDFDRIELWPG